MSERYTITLDMDDVQIEIACEPECFESPEDHFDTGDEEQDRRLCESVRAQLKAGNQWAWCTVTVRATLGSFEGWASLGCCSYDSQEDFIAEGGYFKDLREQAIDDLTARIVRFGGRRAE